jgi:hypothetical protein
MEYFFYTGILQNLDNNFVNYKQQIASYILNLDCNLLIVSILIWFEVDVVRTGFSFLFYLSFFNYCQFHYP